MKAESILDEQRYAYRQQQRRRQQQQQQCPQHEHGERNLHITRPAARAVVAADFADSPGIFEQFTQSQVKSDVTVFVCAAIV